MREWVYKSQRAAFGKALLRLGQEHPEVVALNADLSSSTKTSIFAKEFPERFFNVGIAEANMMGISAGLAVSGKIVFASTFAIFATGRAYDQIRQSIAYPQLNVKIVASHGGITVGGDGASHQMLEDIALMGVLPNMKIIVPADYHETYGAINAAYREDGPVYIRLGRSDVPEIYPERHKVRLGRSDILEDGDDITLAAIGTMVHKALEARDILRAQGVEARVINCSSVKPLDEDTLLKAARETGGIVTGEEHNKKLGFGSMVATLLTEKYPVPMRFLGVNDMFGQSGESEELMEKYGLTGQAMADAAMDIINSRR